MVLSKRSIEALELPLELSMKQVVIAVSVAALVIGPLAWRTKPAPPA
jgi:hypothetical protein